MNRSDFRAFCDTHNLPTGDAGRDWYQAGLEGTYLCAIIRSEEDFAAIKPLLENSDAYLASAERKDGQAWFEHRGYGNILADDANGVAREMASQYENFLSSKDTWYHGTEDIARRDKALADNHALDNEPKDEHFERVAKMQDDGWLTPAYVTEPGWYENDGELLLSDNEIVAGLWAYRYDNWAQCVILVLKNTEEDESDGYVE